MQMARIGFESELKIGEIRNDEEVAELKNSVIGLEMDLAKQRELRMQSTNKSRRAATALGSMDRHDADVAILRELKRMQAICNEKDGRMVALRTEVEHICHDRENLLKVNSRLKNELAKKQRLAAHLFRSLGPRAFHAFRMSVRPLVSHTPKENIRNVLTSRSVRGMCVFARADSFLRQASLVPHG